MTAWDRLTADSGGAVADATAAAPPAKRSRSRKDRGMATQRMVAEWMATHGWPFATSTGAGRSGVDITNVPALSIEVKAVPGDAPGALRQAVRNRGGGLPFVVWRPNSYGPERISEWPVVIRLDDFTALLQQAGYGDGLRKDGPSSDEGDR